MSDKERVMKVLEILHGKKKKKDVDTDDVEEMEHKSGIAKDEKCDTPKHEKLEKAIGKIDMKSEREESAKEKKREKGVLASHPTINMLMVMAHKKGKKK